MSITPNIRVGLVQISENFSGQYYLPYSMGLLQAYAKDKLKNYEDHLFLIPLYKKLPLSQTSFYFKDVDIIFFSTYMWNFNYSIEIAKNIKSVNPGCCIVFGGPQIPENPLSMKILLRKYPFIDIACYGEGEIAFVEILENFQEKSWPRVHSIGYINTDNSFVKNESSLRISDLNQIPSPYLTGIFEPLIKANPQEAWSAMLETNRGCPFTCAYCAWGRDYNRNVYKFDMDRVFGEIDWFSEHKIEFIFCCDGNFGLFKERDMRVVEKVAENKQKMGYPKAFSVQSTKNATRTIFELQERLNSFGLQKGVNLALQSVNKQTLTSVNRSNISSETFQELQEMFTNAGIATFSDMLIGLPDETYDTFTDGVSRVIEGGQHNRIQFINLAVLENTDMADLAYIEKFGLVLQESKMVSHHTSVSSDQEIQETQVLVIGTDAMPKQDWVKTRVFCWMTSLLHFNKLLQIPFVILNKIYSISFKEMIEWFLINDQEYPIISEIVSQFNEKAAAIQSGDTEFIPSEEWLNIYWPADEFVFIRLCGKHKLFEFYKEIKKIINKNLKQANISIAEELIDDLVNLNCELIKQPFITENKKIKSRYNILEFYQEALIGKADSLVKGDFGYEIIRSKDIWDSWLDWCKEVVWFGTKKGAYLYSFLKDDSIANTNKKEINV